MSISINDINKRFREVNSKYDTKNVLVESNIRLYDNNDNFIINNAKTSLNNWRGLDANSNLAFNKALDIFGEICCNCNETAIKEAYQILSEGAVKVRDANQLINSIKYKNSRIKTKISTKINNTNDEVSNAIKDAINNIENKLKSSGVASTTPNTSTAATTQECFDMLLSKAKAIKECDRIVSNYNNISKRFNIDKIISETYRENDIYQSIYDVAKCIDTYDSPFKNKYNTALETAKYVSDKHFMKFSSDMIIEAVTDYFLFNLLITESEIEDIKSVINNSILFESSEFNNINYIFNINEDNNDNNIAEEASVDNYGLEFNVLTEGDLINSVKNKVKEIKKGNPDEHKDPEIEKMINDFRKECMKTDNNATMITKLKALVNKIYTKNAEQIVFEVPKLFSIIRASFILSSASIHPVIAIVALITDQIIKLELSRKQVEKIKNTYKNEISSVKTKLEKSKDNDTKERLQKYLDELNKDLNKIKEYEENLYSDQENDERIYNSIDDDEYADDDDFNFDWDDDEFSFDESQLNNMASIIYISELTNTVHEGLIDDNVDRIIFGNVFKLNNDSLDALTDFSVTVPAILEKDKLCESLISYRDNLRKVENKSIDTFIRINCLNNNISKLQESSTSYNISNSPKGIMCYLMCLDELSKLSSDNEYITEMNFTNTLKLAINNLKRTAIKLTDKEKKISSDIDMAVSNVSKGIENSLTNDSREAIIRGRILPSASKTIKIALATGAAWAINPAIAVIGALGAFACSSKLKAKERQLVLDDIEIELKMCDRYLKAAEEKNDMKAIKQIEIAQRNLQRQQQRIKYKMHVIYNQKVPNIENNDD